jgi:O-antigen/teichoic acid export membrane protein
VVTDSESGVREGLSTVTRGTLFLLIATLCLVGLTFVSRVMLVRGISPADWNAFSFGLTLASLLAAFGTLGLPSAIARSIPYSATDDERRTIVRGSLVIGSVSAFASSAVLWFFAGAIGQALGEPEITLGLEFFPVAVGTSIVATILASIFQGFEDVFPNALFVQIVNPALFVTFLSVALFVPTYGISYNDALIAYAAANASTLGLLIVYTLVRLPRRLPRGGHAPEALGRLLRFAAPLFVVGIMGSVSGSGDTLLLGIYHTGEVGTYSASLTLARLLQIGISALGYIFLPVATKFLRQGDPQSILLIYTTATKWMILFSLPLFLLFFFLPSPSLYLVYGPNYTSVVLPLEIAVVGAFVTTLCGPSNTTQVVYGQTRWLMYNAVVAGLVDLALSFLLIPSYGYSGAAVAWTGANVTYTALSLGQLALYNGVHPFRRHFVAPLLATALPLGILLAILRPSVSYLALPLVGLAVAGLFVVLVLVTRSIDEGDRLLLEAVERILRRRLNWVRRIGRYGLRSRR